MHFGVELTRANAWEIEVGVHRLGGARQPKRCIRRLLPCRAHDPDPLPRSRVEAAGRILRQDAPIQQGDIQRDAEVSEVERRACFREAALGPPAGAVVAAHVDPILSEHDVVLQ